MLKHPLYLNEFLLRKDKQVFITLINTFHSLKIPHFKTMLTPFFSNLHEIQESASTIEAIQQYF